MKSFRSFKSLFGDSDNSIQQQQQQRQEQGKERQQQEQQQDEQQGGEIRQRVERQIQNDEVSKLSQKAKSDGVKEGIQTQTQKQAIGGEDDNNMNSSLFKEAMNSSMRSLFKKSRGSIAVTHQYKKTLETHEEEGRGRRKDSGTDNDNEEEDSDDEFKAAAPVRLRDMLKDTSMKSFFKGSDDSIQQGSSKKNRNILADDGEDGDGCDNLEPAAPVLLRDMVIDNLEPAAPVLLRDMIIDGASMKSLFKGSDDSLMVQQEHNKEGSSPTRTRKEMFDTSMKSVTSFVGSDESFKQSDLQHDRKDGEEGNDDDDNLKAAKPVPLRLMKKNSGLVAKSREDMQDSFRSLSLNDSVDENGSNSGEK